MKKEKFVQAYLKSKPLPIDDIVRARQLEKERSALAARVPFNGQIDDINIDLNGQTTAVRLYTPAERAAVSPCIIYLHGGGFSIGSPDTSDNLCRLLSSTVAAVLISIDYRLAPEHKFPVALEECYQTVCWALDNDVALAIDSEKLAIVGDSAGGNLAAALCLLAREREEFEICHQVLICPLLDQQTRLSDKVEEHIDPILTSLSRETFSRYYFADPVDACNPLASPLSAEELSDLPPATIVSAGLDPLAAEAIRYAQRLEQAGISVHQIHDSGLVHDYPLFVKALAEARQAAADIAADLMQAFS